MSLICCPSRLGLTHFFAIHGSRSGKLIQRCVPCVLDDGGNRGARWSKPWRAGDIELWNKGIFDYSWKNARRDKVAKIKFPDFEEMRKRQQETRTSAEEMRSYQKEKGVVPPRPWNERPLTMTHSNAIFDPYVPKEKEDKASLVSSEGVKEFYTDKAKKTTSYKALRKIRTFIDGFDPKIFAISDASDIYVKVHEMICKLSNCEDNKDLEIQDQIFDYVTEKAYVDILHNTERKTIRWQLVKTLEEPSCVRIRTEQGLDSNDVWAQVTVRFHTQQILAIYDRFGRLMSGSEKIVKDVLEFVVFENHVSEEYGRWRIHAKLIPDWIKESAYASNAVYTTYRKPSEDVEEETEVDIKPEKKRAWRKFVTGRRYVEVE